MKKMIAIALVLVMALALSACGDSQLSYNDRGGNNRVDGNTDGNNSNSTGRTPSNSTYVDGGDFSDGVAWAKTSEGIWHSVDKTGNIVLELSKGERPASRFSHGVALVKREGYDGIVELIDKSGTVISSPESGDYDEIRGFIPDLGMTLVYKRVESFEVTEDQAGIIDSQGNWQVGLCNSQVLTYAAKRDWGGMKDINIGTYEYRHSLQNGMFRDYYIDYCGEGVFALHRTGGNVYNTSIYNITANSGDIKIAHSSDDISPLVRPLRYDNGYGIIRNTITSVGKQYKVCKIDRFGNVEEIFEFTGWWDSGFIGEYRDGLFFFNNNRPADDGRELGFYDINGNKMIDLTDYDVIGTPKFTNGYCLLLLANPQNSQYFTILDRDGNFIVEPIARTGTRVVGWERHRANITLQNGVVVVFDGEMYQDYSGSRTYTLINTSGDTIDLGNVKSVSHFSEGNAIVWLRCQNGKIP